MGEAKRRRDAREEAYAWGRPMPRPEACPGCGAHQVAYIPPGTLKDTATELAHCGACQTVWEAFPPSYVEDPVAAEPCDNCAFRPGSPEQQDPQRWRELLASLRPNGKGRGQGATLLSQGRPLRDGRERQQVPVPHQAGRR